MLLPVRREKPPSMFSAIKWRLVAAIVAGALLVAVYAFQWSIIGRLTLFHFFPLAGAVWWTAAGTAVVGLTCLTRIRTLGLRAFAPTAVIGVSVLIVVFVPFTDLWLDVDYWRYKEARREVVSKIDAGELVPNVAHNSKLITLGDGYPLVSMGGNQVVVEEHDGRRYILFFTFRGILDNYSGFLYVAPGGAPARFADLSEEEFTQILPLEENWYFVSHR
jgi:hypothetical protein